MDHENKNLPITSHINEFLIRALNSEALSLQEIPELNISSDFTPPICTQLNGLLSEVVKSSPGQQNELCQSTKPSTSNASAAPAEYKPIQIIIGDNNDADVPSTSSSLVSSQPESLQDAKVYNRIRELREAGLWDSTKLPKCVDPPRRKTHWDFLLEEVLWMATDFKNERKMKRHWARKIASNAKAVWQKTRDNKKQSTSSFGRDEKEAKRVCSSIAKMIREFWQNVDKVVDFRANEIVESKKRKALDQHLNFLVGAADKITSIIQESLAESPITRQSASTSVVDEHSESEDEASTDDETTIEKEEAANNQQEEELDNLYKERDMDIDQLLTTLPAGYLNSLVPLKNAEEDKDFDEESSSKMESVEDEQTKEMEAVANDAILNDKPDLQNVDCEKLTSENSEVRRKELDNIAEAALEFQPRGYTLETTEVKTEVPFLLCGQLREYQLVGLDWLVTLYEKNLNGILADEMGLGKTIQTIALLAHLACARAVWGPHLIIVPTSVILNWEMELKKWCPSLKILTYFGTAKERAEKRKGWSKTNAFHVCITSYKLATQDIRVFKKKAWQYLILDEAQNIKNFRSQRWQMLLGLRSRRRLLLTGTPLQNSLMELWALLHFLMPNVFASHDDFKDWFHNPITGMVEGTNEVDQALVQRLHKVLRPFILRRLKSEVEKQLPTKTEKIIPCSLSKRQRFLYNEFLSKTATVENLRSGNMLSVLGVIMQLRKCCNHPNLFEPRPVISPYVAPMISPQFPRLIFSIQSQSKEDRRVNLLIKSLHTSMNVWNVFNEISSANILNESSHQNQHEESHHYQFPDGLKFVMDAHGGHFYRPKRPPSESKQATPISNGVTHNIQSAASFVNSTTRKRRWLSGDGQNGESSQQQSSSCSNVPAIFQSALAELKTIEKRRESANQEIGIKLTKILRTFGSPKISTETVRICQQIFSYKDSTSSFGQIGGMLFEKVNERIAQQMLNCWIEPSLNRFLICIKKLVMDRYFEPALISAPERHKNQLLKLCSAKIYSTQSSLAHQVEIASKLEFPELRLIEYDCGKLQVLAKLLGQLHENKHRCLIFTQMSRMLDILQAFLSYHNYKYFRLDGATHIDQRQAMMERFNSDDSIFCFILSTRSGGIGVNLTGADTVIFYDSDWNPTMDAQAQDRCHRIGQTRNVTIYRLISERTIEENILTKSMQKRKLGEMAIDEGEFTPEFFKSATNLRELFSNEETIAEVIAPVVNPAQNSKEIETAMQSVEDQQDVVAAQMAKQETMADSAEFDENLVTANDIDLENPSVQYLELIKALKPIERYAVNFLAKEYRPALDKEFEETEALIKAKQMELMQDEEMLNDEQESIGQSEDSTLDGGMTYESGAPNELPFLATLNTPFDEIPTWMPPSPPNSVEGAPYYYAIDGAYLYESTQIPEEKLPPLSTLISLNEVPPRIRQRKLLGSGGGINKPSSTRLSPSQKRQTKAKKTAATNWPASGGKLANRSMDQPKFRHQKEERLASEAATSKVSSLSSSVTSNSALLSPPNTPMMATASIIPQAVVSTEQSIHSKQITSALFGDLQLNGEQQQRAGSSMSSQQQKAATPIINSLDEAIESTVRKSRKQIGHPPPVSRYLTRYLGPHPSAGSERSCTDQNRVIFRVILATNTLTLPSASSEPIDYEGPLWTANEDFLLLKAITIRHGLAENNHLLLQNAGIQMNWEFISQYLCQYSTNYRSTRQCALRYQNHVLRCDDVPQEKASTSARRNRAHSMMVAPPQSVIFDINFCVQEAANSVRKHSSIVTEIVKNRAVDHQLRLAPSGQQGGHHHSHSSHHHPQQQQTPQLLCMSGRIPHFHEKRLLELGARHSNVARPMDILMKSRNTEPTASAAEGTTTINKGNNGPNLPLGRR